LPQVFTPGAWLESLDGRLTQDQRELGLYERYFDGHHRLRFATEKFRDVFGGLFGTFADNWCQIIVNASVERLQITGFRFGKDEQADSAAWDIWQRNNLDAASVLLHTEAIKVGRAYLLVDPNSGDPRITVEHPSQVIVAHAAGDRTQRLAGLKKWRGEDNYLYANVYLPEVVFKYRSKDPHNGDTTYTRANWIRRPDDPGAQALAVEVNDGPRGRLADAATGGRPEQLRQADRDADPAPRRADAHTSALPAVEHHQRLRRRLEGG
jgi:hypothetical protein